MGKNEMKFEPAFEKLESIVKTLEKGEMSLDDSIQSFEEGMDLINICASHLKDADCRLQKLIKQDDKFDLLSAD